MTTKGEEAMTDDIGSIRNPRDALMTLRAQINTATCDPILVSLWLLRQWEREFTGQHARVEALEKWGEDAEITLVYAASILGGYAKDGNPAEIAEGECDRVFAHWATRRTRGDTMSSQGNLEWYDKNVKTPWVLELEARIEALEDERQHYRHNIHAWTEAIAARDARIKTLERECDGLVDAYNAKSQQCAELEIALAAEEGKP
jgi:hypothetical protein